MRPILDTAPGFLTTTLPEPYSKSKSPSGPAVHTRSMICSIEYLLDRKLLKVTKSFQKMLKSCQKGVNSCQS